MRQPVNLILVERLSRLLRLYRLSQKNKQSKPSNRRANKARLLPKGSAERKLERLGDMFTKAFNELNYMSIEYFFSGKKIDFEGTARMI
ncbi:MAG: hypothetical protein ACP5LF_03295 [Nitrososphaeria archaeon]|nr:hypothetical protein [Conexivisphaerales archaeon]